MLLYTYTAIDDFGKKVEGRLEAESEKGLEERLAKDGYYLLEIKSPISTRHFSSEKPENAKYKVYQHPSSEDIEFVVLGFRWLVLLFGPFWYLWHGIIWRGLFWLGLAVVTGGIVWLVAPFFAAKDHEKHLLKNGYRFIGWADEGKSLMA